MRPDLPDGLTAIVSELMSLRLDNRPGIAKEVVDRIRGVVAEVEILRSTIEEPETDSREFKSSLRTPVGVRAPMDKRTDAELAHALELEVVKTIAAFLNTRGGTLVIGVSDDKAIIGIEVDFPSTRNSRDGWRQAFDNLVSDRLTPAALGSIDLRLVPYGGKTVAIVECRFREQPTWIDEELFVRRTASTRKLSTQQAWDWCREHWKATT